MGNEMSRRNFLRATAGVAGAVALGMAGTAVAEEEKRPEFEGKSKFAGVRNVRYVTDDLVYLGASDRRLALFENVYPIPRGVSYNSYLLLDEKTVLFDTVDRSVSGQFFENLEYALDGRKLDYFIINHMEPDHCSAITEVLTRYPDVILLYSKTAEPMLRQFFSFDPTVYGHGVTEGMDLVTGRHKLVFLMAPLVHWPEVMMTYDATDKLLFSADAFGTFGALDGNLFADELPFEKDWLDDARRYYCNIVGKYGPQVQALLKKAAALDIKTICPLHGPVLTGDLGKYLNYYDLWSSYKAEEPEKILVASASIHGHTRAAAHTMAEKLRAQGAKVVEMDLTRTDVSYAVTEAFRCGKIVLACATYDGFLFPPMENLLAHLKTKSFQNRTVGLMENGTWAPMAAKLMRAELESMKNITLCENVVTIRSAANAAAEAQMDALAAELVAK